MASVQQRIGVLFAVFFGLLAIAAGRTLYLGVLHSAALRRAANTQQVTIEEVPAPRGTITDRHGTVLAISEPADDISADPYLVKATRSVPRPKSWPRWWGARRRRCSGS